MKEKGEWKEMEEMERRENLTWYARSFYALKEAKNVKHKKRIRKGEMMT